MSAPCRGSGRRVSQRSQRTAVYVAGAWRTRCPACGKPAAFGLAEMRTDGMGYVRRFTDHDA